MKSKVALSEIVEIISGGTPKTKVSEYWNGPIPWLSVKDFRNDSRYVYKTEKTITKLGLKNSSTKLLQKDDIIISTRGTIGELAMIPYSMAFNQSCYGIRGKQNVVDQSYLYYLLKNIVPILKRSSHGSVFDTITKETFNNIIVKLPSLEEQKSIAKYLTILDDKIEINEKINENLFKQAQVLYQQSFPYTTSDYLPDGWRIGTVSEIIEIHDSKRIPLSGAKRNKMKRKIYPYYGAASLMDYVDEYIFDGKYLLLGEDGTVSDDAGFPILQYVWGKFWVNNHAHILTGKLGYNVESLYTLFSQTSVNSIITGAVQPKISQASLKSIRVVIPPVYFIEKFNEQIEPMFTLIRNNQDENKRLSAIRDTLLPKLISGELNISKIKV
ncbi:restriction endonuclease subunit S [Enterococcus columbae]|uniref:Type I restriction modification DNA specificity domain-containing protein n=1 Tax=Enterococcus columbae DSM 7374 = ATCC 51263 TaxID=1121865 RepID=S1NTI4_9ENTE|nr:restriction endonuclease subunit S [Enterococcus columbae]EOT44916.1 hypothetical protein OMW_00102 [Enterococcus columbae DSM 7374 = ATCC 51263]EOW84209.1 hypothetical protein I568_00696 [Enterococcus columbae DSM 7374 = ATCC 51263]